jgi:ADP-ribose pyrophosphatase
MNVKAWRTLTREEILCVGDGRFLRVERHAVELPDGHVIDEWPWLITPDFINVVVETTEGSFLCFRQPKYAVEGISLSIVGGYLEPGEDPLPAAKRELLEETGYVAGHWRALGRYAVDGNRGAGVAHLFLARGARWQQPIDADDLEEQELLLLSRAELEDALAQGEFKVLPWAAAVALALPHLRPADGPVP